ncbi:DUF1697 domain-containing protein [Longimicrobium sp.]|uniref:DUF1697 domain-containing protein n=1 Tax=Longimicrobium sp. TaxID=2029185 RepID=UPI002E376987|nr:DUF1697 domain-containing protein [Longimicrobium sp.]HEX6036647.1 DUF1697 domain-containing protein [Longimicrobium sp.]
MAKASPSQRYVAFLRAINVGKRQVKMDRLRAIFEEAGFDDVETFIASGNVIFTAPAQDSRALERRIEGVLKEALGFEVETFLRTPAELDSIARYRPFGDEGDTYTMYVNFLYEPLPADAAERLMALRTEVDEFHVHGREFYWLARKKVSESLVTGPMMSKAIGKVPSTNRNLTTVRKLAEKYPA